MRQNQNVSYPSLVQPVVGLVLQLDDEPDVSTVGTAPHAVYLRSLVSHL